MGKSRKPSVSAARPVQACGRIHAKATDGRIHAKPAEAHARFGAGLADDGIRLDAKPGAGCVRLGKEVAANFRAWFERNFVNRRAGRIGRASYSRAGMFDDRPGDGMWYAEALDRAWIDYRSPLTASEMGYITDHPLIAFQLAAGITDARGLRCMIRGLTLRTNSLQRKAYRSRYYGQENTRRRMLAAERRKITKRTTANPCPTPEAFRAAFARVGESVEAKILFGGMVHDLACYVDSCLRYDGAGNIVGRNGGIKAWLSENVPELHPRYKTIMRYKALAMRFRQAMGVKDPEPTSALFGGSGGDGAAPGAAGANGIGFSALESAKTQAQGGEGEEEMGDENYSAENSHHGRSGNGNGKGNRHGDRCDRLRDTGNRRGDRSDGRGKRGDMRGDVGDSGMENMRRRMRRRKERLRSLFDGCGNTFKDVLARIDAELDRMCSWGKIQTKIDVYQFGI
jgi:hypothetical protein